MTWLIVIAVGAGRLRRLRPPRLEREGKAMAAYYVALQRWDMPHEPAYYERLIRWQAYLSCSLALAIAIVTTAVVVAG